MIPAVSNGQDQRVKTTSTRLPAAVEETGADKAVAPERPERGDAALTIAEAAERSGVAQSALRFHEDQGLIQPQRTAAGHRRYAPAALWRVAFIVFAQRMGLTLGEIRAELSKLPGNRVPERPEWAALSLGWTKRIDARIAELERLRMGLTECIGCGCLSLDRCRLANPGAPRTAP